MASARSDNPKRRVKTPPDWVVIRSRYENGSPKDDTIDKIAKQLGISRSTLHQRAWRENWQQKAKINRKLVAGAIVNLEKRVNARAQQLVEQELAPLIEREKEKITKRGIKIGNKGLSRIEKLWRQKVPTSTRDESDGARAAETFLRIARTSLGMGDGAPIAGPLSPILISHSAVQIVRQEQPAKGA